MSQTPPPDPREHPETPGYPPPPGYPQQPDFGAPLGQPGAPEQPGRQRSGCRGCLLGCLAAFVALSVIAVIVVAAGIFMFNRAFPTAESFEEAATCGALQIGVRIAESSIDGADASASEKAQAQRQLQALRDEFNKRCATITR